MFKERFFIYVDAPNLPDYAKYGKLKEDRAKLTAEQERLQLEAKAKSKTERSDLAQASAGESISHKFEFKTQREKAQDEERSKELQQKLITLAAQLEANRQAILKTLEKSIRRTEKAVKELKELIADKTMGGRATIIGGKISERDLGIKSGTTAGVALDLNIKKLNDRKAQYAEYAGINYIAVGNAALRKMQADRNKAESIFMDFARDMKNINELMGKIGRVELPKEKSLPNFKDSTPISADVVQSPLPQTKVSPRPKLDSSGRTEDENIFRPTEIDEK